MRRSQEVSQYSAESRRRSEALTGAALGRRPDLAEFNCCVDGHRAAVQKNDTVHVRRSTHGAKRDTKLKYRTVMLEFLSRLPRRDRVSHSAVEGPQLTMPWQSSADQTEKKHTYIFSRAREGEAACERDMEQEPHSGAGGRTANNDHTQWL